ncbi:FMN-binding negative transcriptional regulator [Ramlibacter sp. H39-3-26]|uniref:FMN-binding negative transcriptional regulator n=1 Tax=Curvibacter soli TaxID=3031331 RepID=UPI0023DB3206|nr:FMN-binding negative transcriptional regulator [Ramlibacter sp. H39-3-26]MDF1484424.1 FMN-binding negative transcriptional regulator [Ramlibacter sp. H39-3-26]
MYLPPQFDDREHAHALALMRAHPFASLVSTDDEGLPFITHLPLHAEQGAAGALTLWGHCARPSPQWRYLQSRPRAVAAFMGPHAYLSPGVYPDLARVPTWNYLAVHCTVEARLVEDAEAKDALLKKLIADHEPAYAAQWRGLGDDFARKMLAGIVGFELQVTALQSKLKLNQHRPESHAAMHAAYARGGAQEQALAAWMRTLDMVKENG